jgi:insulysin
MKAGMFFFIILLFQVFAFGDYQLVENKADLPILNPALAERKIAKLRLENGVEVYLISDPGADQSAAALSVEAGSWQDPENYPGMAHFLEHMLFMGTAAYPKEFEYMQYITDNGGTVNASTWPDHTVYMFSVNNEAFRGALDRFSHFFIDPLFSRSCIDRELHAVDQEHAKNIENDEWRTYMIYKETGNPKHPNANFSTGNAKTLSGIPQKALKEWYEDYYSPEEMHLCMISPLPLEEMVSLSTESFSKIPDRQKKRPAISEMMSSQQQLGHTIYIKPVKDIKRLSLVWEVPAEFVRDTERKGLELIAYALEADGEHSLLETLKKTKNGEAVRVSTERYSRDQAILCIDISLTPQGISQLDRVISDCFQAIATLKQKGIPLYLFDELKALSTLNYQYQSRSEAFLFVMKTANEMLYEELATYPEKSTIPTLYDPHFLSALIETLIPQTCTFIVTADPKLTHVATTSSEKWMQAEYAIKKVPEKQLVKWSQDRATPQIDLPPHNPYIPSQLALVSPPEASSCTEPSLIANNETGKVYFLQDCTYSVPEVSISLGIKTPLIDGSIRKGVLTELYIKALTEKLSSSLFFADRAGLSPSFFVADLKLMISLEGYSEKAPLLMKEIFQQLKEIHPTQEDFDLYKESLLMRYDNGNRELPVMQANELLRSLLFKEMPTNSEKYTSLKSLSYQEFLEFSGQLLKKSYTEGLFYGNLQREQAVELYSTIKNLLASSPYPLDQHFKRQILLLPDKSSPYLIVQNTERQGNGVVLLLQEGPFSFERRAAQQVLSKALRESFFDTLRTKQQTGYFVRAWESEVERQLFQFFAVQSSTHQPRDLVARFELFLEDFLKNFDSQISTDRFETLRRMLIVTLRMPPENLQKMGDRLYTLAFEYDGDFKWYEKNIESLKALTYEELKTCASAFLSRENSRRLAILFQGVLAPENQFIYEQVTTEELRSVSAYVASK